MSNHEQIKEKLIDMTLGQLPDSEKNAILKHIEDCAECKALCRNLTKVLDAAEKIRTAPVDEQLCDSAKDKLLASIKSEQTAPPEHIDFGIWRTIMKNPLIKIAAAAVIIFAIVLTISLWPKHQEDKTIAKGTQSETQQKITGTETLPEIEPVKTKDDILQRQLKDVEAMFAAADTKGLIKMLKTGQYEAKVAAANYLAQLGDVNAVEPLETTAGQYAGTSQAQPFIDATELLKAAESTQAGAGTAGTEEPSASLAATDDFTFSEILNALPAETLFCLRFNKLDYGLMGLDQYLDGVSPVPMAASMGARMQLSQLLADPALTNVDTVSDFAVFGIVKPGSEGKGPDDMAVVFLVPMKDYDKFVQENTNCSSPDANGVSVISQPNKKLNMLKLGNYGLICVAGDYKVLLDIAEILKAPGKSLAEALPPAVATSAKEKPLWAYANIQQCAPVLSDFVSKKIKELQDELDKIHEQTGQQAAPKGVFDFYQGYFDILFTETEYTALSIEPTAESLDIQIVDAAVPGTPSAIMYATNPNKKPNELLHHLSDNSIFNMAMNMNSPLWQEMSLFIYDIIAMTSEEITEDTSAKLQFLISDISSVSGNSVITCGIVDGNQPDFHAETIIELKEKDPEKWKELDKQLMQLWVEGGFADVYSKHFEIETDFQIESNVESYRGVSIDSSVFTLKPTDPNSEYGQLIQGIYDEGISYRNAIVDGFGVNVIGTDCEQRMHNLIDRIKSGRQGEIPAEFTTATATLNDVDKCDFFGTVNIVRYLSLITQFLAAAQDVELPKQIDLTSESNLAFGGICENGTMNMQVVMPRQHLLEIIDTMKVVGPIMNKANMQQQAQPADSNQN